MWYAVAAFTTNMTCSKSTWAQVTHSQQGCRRQQPRLDNSSQLNWSAHALPQPLFCCCLSCPSPQLPLLLHFTAAPYPDGGAAQTPVLVHRPNAKRPASVQPYATAAASTIKLFSELIPCLHRTPVGNTGHTENLHVGLGVSHLPLGGPYLAPQNTQARRSGLGPSQASTNYTGCKVAPSP